MRVEADANLDKALHLKTQREGIEARRIALNDTPFLEAPDPRPARRFGEPDRFAQLRKGLESVLFQRGNDFPVESVHILCLGWIGVSSPHLCRHVPRNAIRPMPFVFLGYKSMPNSMPLLPSIGRASMWGIVFS